MTKQNNNLALALDMLEAAMTSIKSAYQILEPLVGSDELRTRLSAGLPHLQGPVAADEGQIVEGVFDGERMQGADGKTYPVPANYSSKSKLVEGDVLKLTIALDGRLIYKQIGPVPRTHAIGKLITEDGRYKIFAEGRIYAVNTASVTFHKVSVGDRVSILLPEGRVATWAAVDALLPAGTMLPGDETDIAPAA